MIACLGALHDVRRPLVVGESSGALAEALRSAGAAPSTWLREASTAMQCPPLPWPEGEEFDAALIRLPKAKDSLMLALHAAASKTLPGSAVAVFGANGEGIRSAAPRLEQIAGAVETLDTGHHARVLAGRRKTLIQGLKGRLEDWRHAGAIDLGGGIRPWVSYPGTFAKGELDAGTAFLIQHLPKIAHGARVLDFAAGTGVVAAAIAARGAGLEIDMVEADALAVAAARENVPGARCLLGASLAAVEGRKYDLIVSNPPIHEGIGESHAVLERLIVDAPAHLHADGMLLLVLQRRVAVLPLLTSAFPTARKIADNGRFTVVMAERGGHAR
jgi:16S rRNA (guanine1207-N2)-methyltransferase